MVDILTPVGQGLYDGDRPRERVAGIAGTRRHGFIEETGAAQYYRDQRITPIYEGTNGIQALDLIGRKLVRDNGRIARMVIGHIRDDMSNVDQPGLKKLHDQTLSGLDDLEAAIETVLSMAADDMRKPGSIADPYLRLWGHRVLRMATGPGAAVAMTLKPDSDRFYAAKIETARFYFAYEMPKRPVTEASSQKRPAPLRGWMPACSRRFSKRHSQDAAEVQVS